MSIDSRPFPSISTGISAFSSINRTISWLMGCLQPPKYVISCKFTTHGEWLFPLQLPMSSTSSFACPINNFWKVSGDSLVNADVFLSSNTALGYIRIVFAESLQQLLPKVFFSALMSRLVWWHHKNVRSVQFLMRSFRRISLVNRDCRSSKIVCWDFSEKIGMHSRIWYKLCKRERSQMGNRNSFASPTLCGCAE